MSNKLHLSPTSIKYNANSSLIRDSKMRKSTDAIFHKKTIKKDTSKKENPTRLSLEYSKLKKPINYPNINEFGIQEMDELIKSRLDSRKQYSKTYIETQYQALTDTEKQKVLEDLNSHSNKRMFEYSKLFKEIKTQMTHLSNSFNNSAIESEIRQLSPRFNREEKLNKVDEENEFLDNLDFEDGDRKVNSRKNIIIENINENYSKPNVFRKSSMKINHDSKLENTITMKGLIHHSTSKSMIKTVSKNFMNLECDINDCDENVGEINIPGGQYQSNFLQDVEFSSSVKKFSTGVYHKRSSSYNNEPCMIYNSLNKMSQRSIVEGLSKGKKMMENECLKNKFEVNKYSQSSFKNLETINETQSINIHHFQTAKMELHKLQKQNDKNLNINILDDDLILKQTSYLRKDSNYDEKPKSKEKKLCLIF